MIKISSVTKKDQLKIKRFNKTEWYNLDKIHYGQNFQNYVEKPFHFKAINNHEIVGEIDGKYEAGVVFINDIIVAKTVRGQGVGERLLNKAVAFGKQWGVHKIMLFTGTDWEARKFYEKHGFKSAGILKNHFCRKDFLILEKYVA